MVCIAAVERSSDVNCTIHKRYVERNREKVEIEEDYCEAQT